MLWKTKFLEKSSTAHITIKNVDQKSNCKRLQLCRQKHNCIYAFNSENSFSLLQVKIEYDVDKLKPKINMIKFLKYRNKLSE